MTKYDYVHGYSKRELLRLEDQANTLDYILHHDTIYQAGSRILEAGCGSGAQTKIIAKKNPDSHFISIDTSESSLKKAEKLIEDLSIKNVNFEVGNILDLKYDDKYFDHVFICFVLEHLSSPVDALKSLKRVLQNGGSITVIEGDHGSTYCYPYSSYAERAIQSQVSFQTLSGGNALIGRQIYPLLKQSGFKNCTVSPRMVYVDSSKPELVEGFTKNTFIAMI
ncbi:unnamed protein product, partial [marine sediment metagenome]